MPRRLAAELLGTYALVLAGCGAMVVDDVTGGGVSHVGVALTFGLVVFAMIVALGDVSGAHVNPAATLALWAARRFPAREVAPYVAAQCVGALLAAASLRALFPAHETLGATLAGDAPLRCLALETLLTWLLAFTILSSRGAGNAAAAIGAVVGLEALFAGPITGASMNPARSLGPALVSGRVDTLWVYLLAPALGALLAVASCRFVRPRGCCEGGCA